MFEALAQTAAFIRCSGWSAQEGCRFRDPQRRIPESPYIPGSKPIEDGDSRGFDQPSQKKRDAEQAARALGRAAGKRSGRRIFKTEMGQ
jgi:hypothetical protein